MIQGLVGHLGAAAERRLCNYLLSVVAAAVVALFAAVSLGFGTFAAYVCLRASEGRVVAALIVCAAYGLLAITIWTTTEVVRRRADRLRRVAAASPASTANVDSLLQSLAADSIPLVAAMRLARELSPMQLFALALIGGFVAGRKLGK